MSIIDKLKILSSLDKVEQVPAEYLIPTLFYYSDRAEAFEVYALSYLENYIGQHRVNVARTKLESDEELPVDGDAQPMPVVQVNLDDCVVYQRVLPVLNKPALAKNKFTCFVYIN